MILADISAADPRHVQDVLVILVGLIVAVSAVGTFVLRLLERGRPARTELQQPVVVEWSTVDRRLTAAEQAIIAIRDSHRIEAEERARRIYERIEEVRNDLETRIDGLPERVIALLRNTGVIHDR